MEKVAEGLKAALAIAAIALLLGLGFLLLRIEEELKAQSAVTWVDAVAIERSCIATNSEYTCTFTNKLAVPVTTCLQGSLTPKGNPAAAVKSMTACSGRLRPAETKTITVPWVGSFATEICSTEERFGKRLDWSKCDFETEPVSLKNSIVTTP